MRVLSLFSGGGLGDYGLTLAGMEIVGQVEIDEYCQKILKLRWPDVPKWRDIREVKGSEVLERCGTVDLISGGFPCQPYSTAARGRNIAKCLWKEMLRIIREIKPRLVLAENVSRANHGGFIMSASEVGAPHIRKRLWLFAHANNESELYRPIDAKMGVLPKVDKTFWETDPRNIRVDDGGSFRMERYKLLGNGQVVQVVEWIGKRIMEFDSLTSKGVL